MSCFSITPYSNAYTAFLNAWNYKKYTIEIVLQDFTEKYVIELELVDCVPYSFALKVENLHVTDIYDGVFKAVDKFSEPSYIL